MSQDEILSWIREDIKGIREDVSKIYDKLDTKLDDKKLTEHEIACPARTGYAKKNSSPPSPRASMYGVLTKLGPIILAAALGLLGLGAYLGSSNQTGDLQKEITAMKKILKASQ